MEIRQRPRLAIAGVIAFVGCHDPQSRADTWNWDGTETGIDLDPTDVGSESSGIETSADTDTGAEIQLDITPANPILDVVAGGPPSGLAFEARATAADGSSTVVPGAWSFDRPDLAMFDGSTLRATGLAGGIGTVTVETTLGTATTSVTLVLRVVDDPDGVGPMVQEAFDDADLPDPALDILYPYDGTVFPRGLPSPTMMWNGGGAQDVYRVHLSADTFDYVGFRVLPPPSRFSLPTLPVDLWRQLTDSVVGDVQVDIQRYDGVRAYLPETTAWTISSANLRGAIYYWQVTTGEVVRINPGATAPESFIQSPDGECVACHSVSRDGSTIVASRDGGASPWSLYDATAGTELYRSDAPSGFQALSPEGEFVVWRQWTDDAQSPSSMVLSVADETEPLAYLEPLDGTPTHPTWSPDGASIAFGVRRDGTGLDFTSSTLWTAAVDTITPGFSDLREIALSDPTRPVLTYPTFSPDSAWIAFMRATNSRTRVADGELWMVARDGSAEFLLESANGGAQLPAAQTHTNYQPTFSPVASGGYFWLVFVSVRPYGNTLIDENPDSRLKQLWVSAIDAAPTPGEDPSHPAFWLPGQSLDSNNMRGSWALSPCKSLGASCEAGYECCDGFCIDDPEGEGKICAVPEGCARIDDACETSADCCDALATCTGGFCADPYIP